MIRKSEPARVTGGMKSQAAVMYTNPNVKAMQTGCGNLRNGKIFLLRRSSKTVANPWRMKNAVTSHVACDWLMQQKITSWIKPETKNDANMARALATRGGFLVILGSHFASSLLLKFRDPCCVFPWVGVGFSCVAPGVRVFFGDFPFIRVFPDGRARFFSTDWAWIRGFLDVRVRFSHDVSVCDARTKVSLNVFVCAVRARASRCSGLDKQRKMGSYTVDRSMVVATKFHLFPQNSEREEAMKGSLKDGYVSTPSTIFANLARLPRSTSKPR